MSGETAVGLYSTMAAARHGTSFWRTPDGREVEITAKNKPSEYNWPDAQIVGEVTKFIRRGQDGVRDDFSHAVSLTASKERKRTALK